MSKLLITCKRCNKRYKDQRSLTQHQRKSTVCRAYMSQTITVNMAEDMVELDHDLLAFSRVQLAKRRSDMAKTTTTKANEPAIDAKTYFNMMASMVSSEPTLDELPPIDDDMDNDFEPPFFDDEIDNTPLMPGLMSQPGGVSDLSNPDWIRQDWKNYEKRAMHFAPFTPMELQGIRLLILLRNCKASLAT